MTSIHAYDPASGAVPPELPPMSIAILAVGVLDVLCEAEDLPQPRYISMSRPLAELLACSSPRPGRA